MDVMKHYELCTFDEKLSPDCCTYSEKIWSNVVDTTDNAIVQTIINFAKQEGITDLYLLDREFVTTALMREAERRKEGAE